jgi:cytochrome c biogenesis factor
MTDLGELSLWIALLMAVWGAVLSYAGGAFGRDDLLASGERGLLVAAPFVALAAAGLCWALLSDDFTLRYVAMFSNEDLPAPYKFSAAWAGNEGSILLFAFFLAALAAVALRTGRKRNRDLMPWVAGSLALVLAIVLVAAATRWSPFERIGVAAADGRGLDPRLQNPAVAARVPLLYCGYAAACVALAYTGAAAVKRRFDAGWLGTCRAWVLVAWCFVTTSILLALRIGYADPGSLGYWLRQPAGAPAITNVFDAMLAFGVATAALVGGASIGGGWKRVRRSGRWALVAGAVLSTGGLAARALRSQQVVELPDGGTVRAKDPFGRDWSFTSQGASRIERANHFVTAVALRSVLGESRARFITSEIREYYGRDDPERFAPYTTAGIRVSPLEDVVVTLEVAEEGKARVRIGFVPFAGWVWIGGVLLVLGGAIALWPPHAARGALA